MKAIITKFCLFSIYILIFSSSNIYINCKDDYNILVYPVHSFLPKSNKENINEALISSLVYRMLYMSTQTESGLNISMPLNYDEAKIHTNNQLSYFRDRDKEGDDKRYSTDIDEVCNFNYKASNTYRMLTDFIYTFYSKSKTCYASENIILYRDIDLKQSSINTIKFIHASNDTHNCFCTGLIETDSISDLNYSFFYQFKKLINSKKFSWSLHFTNYNEGKFIFGDIINNTNLHFYNDNNEDNYLAIKEYKFSKRVYYKIKFENLIIGNYVNNTATYYEIDIHKRYITVSIDLFYKIKELYMLDTSEEKGICKEVNLDNSFFTIFCNKKKFLEHTDSFKKLKDLIFFYKNQGVQYNFSFSPKELFLEKDDYLYFFIGYGKKYKEYDDEGKIDINIYNSFSLGTLFLEKYTVVFDDDVPCLYILKTKVSKEEEGNSFVIKIVIIAVLIFVFCALVFVIIGKLYGKKLFGGRKKKANELLDDDYDYSTKDFNDQTKKDGLFKENEENGNENTNENGA